MNASKLAKLGNSKGKAKTTKPIPCSFCGRTLWITKYYQQKKQYKKYYCDKSCEAKCRSFGQNLELKGGWIGTGGYHYVRVNGKHQLAHRAVMENMLDRKLRSSEHVHHLNGIKLDNRPENLVVVSNRNHPTETSKLVKILQERVRELENVYSA